LLVCHAVRLEYRDVALVLPARFPPGDYDSQFGVERLRRYRPCSERFLQIAGFLKRLILEVDDDSAPLKRDAVELALARGVRSDSAQVCAFIQPAAIQHRRL